MSDPSWESASSMAKSDGAQSEPDRWLMTVMRNERNRATLISLEKLLGDFVRNPGEDQLAFPPKGRFHRKVCHAVALWYKLEHRLEQAPNDSSGQLRLVLIKTPSTALPRLRLADILGSTTQGQANTGPTQDTNYSLTLEATTSEVNSATTTRGPCGVSSKGVGTPRVKSSRGTGGGDEAAPTSNGRLEVIASSYELTARDTNSMDSQTNRSDSLHENPGQTEDAALEEESSLEPTQRPAVLRRPMNVNGRLGWRNTALNVAGSSAGSGTTAVRNVTEEEYESARARIFQASSESDADFLEPSLRNLSVSSSRNGQVAAERYASGPVEGSIGFTRFRGRRAPSAPAGAHVPTGISGVTKPIFAEATDSEVLKQSRNGEQRASTGALKQEHADRHDPDFDRCYSKWIGSSNSQGPMHQFFIPGTLYENQMHSQARSNAEHVFGMNTSHGFQMQQQLLYHQNPTNSTLMLPKVSYGDHGHLFGTQQMYHLGVLHDSSQIQVHHSQQFAMHPNNIRAPHFPGQVSASPDTFPYSASCMQYATPRSVDWQVDSEAPPHNEASVVTQRQGNYSTYVADARHTAGPTYGLDSRNDFPTLSEAHSFAKQ